MVSSAVVYRLLRMVMAVAVISVALVLASAAHGQDAPPVWRTMLVSNSTPAVGEQTEVFFEIGNRSTEEARLGGLVCSVTKLGADGLWSYSTDLRPVSVIDKDGYPVLFFWGDGPLYIITTIPTNALPADTTRSYRILFDVVGNTDSENLISCGVEYSLGGQGGYISGSLYVAVWEILPDITLTPPLMPTLMPTATVAPPTGALPVSPVEVRVPG